jgi:glycerol uptake facilitator-like aquaporin
VSLEERADNEHLLLRASFANPAAAFGRMFSNTFAGISPSDAPAFVIAQMVGGFLGLLLHTLLKSDHPL